MSFQGASDPVSSVNLDVTEIAAILRQVQSGQLTLQQQQRQQQQQQRYGGLPTNQQGFGSNFEEEDKGLSLIQSTETNYGLLSQPLRRPGRAPQQSGVDDGTSLSRSALQKQIFAARLMSAPTVGGKLGPGGAQNSGPKSNIIKPNLAASRHVVGVAPPPGIFGGSGPSSSTMTQPVTQEARPGIQETLLGALHGNGRETSVAHSGHGQGTPWSTSSPNSQGRNTPYGDAHFSPHPSSSISQTSSPQMPSLQINSPQINSSSGSPLVDFSHHDVDLRHRDVDLRNSPFSQTSSPLMTTTTASLPIRPVGAVSYTNFQSSMTNPSKTSFPAGGKFSQGGVGMMSQGAANTNSYKPWQERGEDARKRKLENELAEFEMQVGPSKQMRTGFDKNESRPHVGTLSGGGAAVGNSPSIASGGGTNDSEGSPYQWSTNYVHPLDADDKEEEEKEDRGKYEEIDVEGWIDSLVTYKKPGEVDPDSLSKRISSAERRDGKESSRRDRGRGRRRSSSPRRKSRWEPDGGSDSSRERNRRGGSAGKDRPRSPVKHRSPPRSSSREDRGRRSPVRRRAERSLRHEERSPQGKKGRSPRRRSPGHEKPKPIRSPRQDHNEEDKSGRRGSQGPSSGRDSKRTSSSESNARKSQKERTDDAKKKDQTSHVGANEDTARKSGPRLIQNREEKKTIKINLEFQKGKDKIKSGDDKPPSSSSCSAKNDKTDRENQKDVVEMTKKVEAEKSEAILSTGENDMLKSVGENSVQHQISLFTKLSLDSYITNKQIVESFCYLCQMPCNDLQGYRNHVVDKKHKDNVAKAMTSSGKPLFIKYLRTLPDAADDGTTKSPKKGQTGTIKEDDKTKTCYECRQTYTGNLHEHLRSAEHQQNAHKTTSNSCPTCDMKFSNYRELKQHYHTTTHMKKAQEKLQKIQEQPKEGLPPSAARTQYGMELIIPVYGYFCRACIKFYNGDKITREQHSVNPDHLKSVKIYYNKVKQAEEEAKASETSKNQKKEQNDDKQKQTPSDTTKTDKKHLQDSSSSGDKKQTDSFSKRKARGASHEPSTDTKIVDLTKADSQVESDDVIEIEIEHEDDADDGKCARSRLYVRKTKKIATETIKTAAITIAPAIQGQLKEKEKSQGQSQVKDQNDKLDNEKDGDDKNGGAEVEKEPSVLKSSDSKNKSDKVEMGKKDDDKESKRSSSRSRSETPRKERKDDRSSSERKDRSSRSSSRNRSEESRKDERKSSRSFAEKGNRSSSQGRLLDIRYGRSGESQESSSGEKHRSSPSQNSRPSKSSEGRDCMDRDSRRSSSRGRESSSRRSRERSERRRTSPSSRGNRKDDHGQSRSDRSRSSREARCSRRDSKTEENSDFPNLDDMVAIDEVGGSGDDEIQGSGSDGGVGIDEEAMKAMMSDMGMDWQVVSELEDTDEMQNNQ